MNQGFYRLLNKGPDSVIIYGNTIAPENHITLWLEPEEYESLWRKIDITPNASARSALNSNGVMVYRDADDNDGNNVA